MLTKEKVRINFWRTEEYKKLTAIFNQEIFWVFIRYIYGNEENESTAKLKVKNIALVKLLNI